MTRSANILILLFFILSATSYAQTAGIVEEDHFDNNETGWRLPNSPTDQSDIRGGKLVWQHNDPAGGSINNYFNLLNTSAAFSAEAKFGIRKPGSEYGLMIGADQENALYFNVKNLQYRVLEIKKGKPTLIKDFTTSLKIKVDNNILKIEKSGSTVRFLANDYVLTEISYPALTGKAVGFSAWGASSFDVDDFFIKGTKLKINTAPNLNYSSPAENLGAGVNTVYGELTPVVTPDGKGLYFTRNYSPENKGGTGDYQDVYYSSYQNGKWGKAVNIGAPINNDGPNAVSSVSPDGNTVLLMNTYDSKGAAQGMGLSMSNKTKNGWSMPTKVNVRNYYNKSTFNEYFLSSDKKVLLMALQRDETYGSRDIYVSFLENDNTWSVPKNIGPVVNTPGTELSPFLAADGVTLYFSSTGHPGYGKNDIFVSRRLDNTWTNWSVPQNIGLPVNSKGMDAYYSIPASGEYAYFISEEKATGKSDIFRIKLPGPVKPNPLVLIYGKVLNSKTKEPIETGITYRDLDDDKEAGIASSDPHNGDYKIALPYNQVYSFFAEHPGFYSVRDTISVPNITEYMEIERDIYLTPLEVGEDIPLKNVFFVRSEPKLLPISYPELNKLAKLLIENPTIEIELSGHTDNMGNPEKNVTLSEQRVETVKNYLISKGISGDRISGKGYGGSKPIADNTKEETRKLNRRVEFKIVKF
ncbi:outer membrane protein [Sporocytophaga myxococcoides]|uniref:Outer membrane protein n=1 Tax=Sporocytophaga myxococcoides TaxID=153721 RepID=A0A098LA00_9BACT|nr:OmpA family protein [Sporocytophaga myxococcoides]GAL83227.1 outer membrane protein [Sporocytophaga myxococcoides]